MEQVRQQEQLDNINNLTYDIKSILAVTKKKIRYFGRAIYKDKCIMCMIVSSLLAIIIIVVLAMTGNDNDKFTGVPKDTITEETGWE